MPQITVLRPFLLNLGGTIHKFEAGIVEVTEEVASHWYAKLFSVPMAEPAEAGAVLAEDDALIAEIQPLAPAEVQADDSSITIEGDGSIHVDVSADDVDEKAALKAEAEALGIDVDGRWGVGRLKAEIEAKKNAA